MDLEPGASLSGTRIGPYLIGEKIGAGGMGEVYRASDERLRRTVAIKALPARLATDATRARMAREAKLTCSVTHPYIATVFDVVEHGAELLLAMEYIEGRTLTDVLREDRPDLPTAVRYAREIAEALNAIHRAGVVHRDLKPGNVMITDDGHVKVMDFGLARREEPETIDSAATTVSGAAPLTQTGQVLGTPLYMSPEQMRGEVADSRSDLFSFGILLYESITGEHPFRRATPQLSMAAILHEPPSCGVEPESLSGSGPLRDIVLGLLEKDREQRTADAGGLLAALRDAERLYAPYSPLSSGRRALAVVTLVGLVALVAGTYGWLTRPPQWDAPRATIAIAPFRNQTQLEDGPLAASMVGELLVADLSGSHLVRVVGPERTAALTEGLAADGDSGDLVDRVVAGTAADYVLVGTLFNEGEELTARVDIVSTDTTRVDLPSFRASGATALKLVGRLGTLTRRGLPRVNRLTALRDGWAGVEDVVSADEEARKQYQLGILAVERGDLGAAIGHYEAAVAADPLFAAAYRRLALTLHSAGHGRRAREAVDRAVSVSPRPSDLATERLALTNQVAHARVYGRAQEVVDATAKLAARFPDEPAILSAHADAIGLTGDYDTAAALFDRADELAPDSPWLALDRAVAEMRAKKETAPETAGRAESLFRAAGAGYWAAEAIFTRGRALSALQRLPEAVGEFERAVAAVAPDDRGQAARIELEIGRVEALMGNLDAASARIDAASVELRRNGNLGGLCHALSVNGARLYAKGDYADARVELGEAVDLARRLENDALLLSPLSNLAGLLSHLGEVGEARDRFAETLPIAKRLGRESTEVLSELYLAGIEYHLGNIDEALEAYGELQRRKTGTDLTRLTVWSFLGVAEVEGRRGNLAETLAQAERALEIARERGLTDVLGYSLVRRAHTLVDLGRITDARRDLDEADAIAGRGLRELEARAAVARAAAEFRDGRSRETLLQVDRARKLGADAVPPVASEALRLACAAHLELGDTDRAVEQCRAAADLDPVQEAERAESAAWLAWGLSRGTETGQEARLVAADAMTRAREMGLHLALARAAAVLSDDETRRREGIEALRRYIEAAPEADREAVRGRSDLNELEAILGGAAGVSS